jgi:hypothetical protein
LITARYEVSICWSCSEPEPRIRLLGEIESRAKNTHCQRPLTHKLSSHP